MASTKPIKAEYSVKLDGMTAYVRDFLAKNLNDEVILRTHKGIADFCYKNSTSFKKEFLQRVGLSKLKTLRRHHVENQYNNFVLKLSEMNAECVFLLKDAYNVIAAANSYRDDTPEEKNGYKNFLGRNAKGGNTDGIAGLTGAFAGAHLGFNKIPRKFLSVENREKLVSLGQKLV